MKLTHRLRPAWLGLCLIGAVLVETSSNRPLLRAGDADTAPAAAAINPQAKAEVEDAAEAATTLGGDSGSSGLHLSISPGDGEVVKIGGDGHVKKGEQARTLVVVFGNATMEGEVAEEMVVVFGNATVDGEVRGDFVNVMGSTQLGPNAKLKGDCVVVGGKLTRDPGAQLAQEPVEVSFGALWSALEPLGYWFRYGLLLGRPLPPTSGLAWVFVGLHFIIYLIILVLIPKPVEACVKVLNVQPLPAFLVGLLAMVLVGPLVIVLMASGIGLLIVPFVWIAMLAARYVGKTALFQFIGLQLFRRGNPDASSSPLLAFLVGTALVTVLYMIPILGLIVWGVLLPLALGAALMAAFAALRSNGNGRTSSASGPYVPSTALAADGTAVPADPSPAGGAPSDSMARSALTGPTFAEMAALPRVGFWLRLGATALDFLLFVWLIPTTGPFFLPAWLIYHVGMWSWKGTTIGGIVCGLKVVRLDGRPVDFGVALVRSLGSVLSFMALCLGFFWAGWNRDRQSWHDTIAGTTIVKVPKGVSLI